MYRFIDSCASGQGKHEACCQGKHELYCLGAQHRDPINTCDMTSKESYQSHLEVSLTNSQCCYPFPTHIHRFSHTHTHARTQHYKIHTCFISLEHEP